MLSNRVEGSLPQAQIGKYVVKAISKHSDLDQGGTHMMQATRTEQDESLRNATRKGERHAKEKAIYQNLTEPPLLFVHALGLDLVLLHADQISRLVLSEDAVRRHE